MIDLDGDTLVVGAPGGGFAYVFEREANGPWAEVAQLGTGVSGFGRSVAVSGDMIAIGVAGDPGQVVLAQRTLGSWAVSDTIIGTTAKFGYSVALDGDLLAVGAGDPNTSPNAGAAYVYRLENGMDVESWSLVPVTSANPDDFGAAVAIDGDTVVVGAPSDFVSNSGPPDFEDSFGSAFVFERDLGGDDAWGERRRISSGVPGFTGFGNSVGIDGDTAVVLAYNETLEEVDTVGAAYVFGRDSGGSDNWGFLARLQSEPASQSFAFGTDAVDIDGGRIVVGYPASSLYVRPGVAYLFERGATADDWVQAGVLGASDAPSFSRFGWAVAIQGSTLAVGDPLHDHPVGGPCCGEGAVYAYEILPELYAEGLLFSLQNAALSIPGVGTVRDEDIVRWDPEDGYSMFWDGGEHGVTANVDGFSLASAGGLMFSFGGNVKLPGLGVVAAADTVRWTEEGSFERWLDGSDAGLTTANEDVDAIHDVGEGLILSTAGSYSLYSGASGLDEDVWACGFIPEPNTTSCLVYVPLVDGSDAGLGGASEDVSGLALDSPLNYEVTTFYLSMTGNWAVPGLSGTNEDVLSCEVSAFGGGECLAFELYFDGTDHGLPASATLDAIHVPLEE